MEYDPSFLPVMQHRCNECLLGPNRVVSETEAERIIDEVNGLNTHFVCHKASMVGRDVCCRGFYDLQSTLTTRLARHLDRVVWVNERELR